MAALSATAFGVSAIALQSLFARAMIRVRAWNAARSTRRVLRNLPDQTLEDIGLTRWQIDAIR